MRSTGGSAKGGLSLKRLGGPVLRATDTLMRDNERDKSKASSMIVLGVTLRRPNPNVGYSSGYLELTNNGIRSAIPNQGGGSAFHHLWLSPRRWRSSTLKIDVLREPT